MAMPETKTVALPNGLMAEMEKVALAQQRSVDDVLVDAVERYLNHEEFREVLSFGERHARSLGLTPVDVATEIARSRENRGR
jgi:hypothetical protein